MYKYVKCKYGRYMQYVICNVCVICNTKFSQVSDISNSVIRFLSILLFIMTFHNSQFTFHISSYFILHPLQLFRPVSTSSCRQISEGPFLSSRSAGDRKKNIHYNSKDLFQNWLIIYDASMKMRNLSEHVCVRACAVVRVFVRV